MGQAEKTVGREPLPWPARPQGDPLDVTWPAGRNASGIPDDELASIVASVLRADPDAEAVYLFGSRARGDWSEESDVDIYVVSPDNGETPARRGAAIRRSLLWMRLPKDVVVQPPGRFASLSRDLWNVECSVAREGVLLYGAGR